MAVFVIDYDLQVGADYEPLLEALRQFEGYCHTLKSTWLIASSLSCCQVRDLLSVHLSRGDKLLVMECTGRPWAAQGLPQAAVEWLHSLESASEPVPFRL